jgi:hypothetical protein
MTSSLNVLKQLLQEEKFDEALNLVYSLCQFYENKFIKNLYDAIKQRNVTLACYFIDNYFKEFKPITHENIDILGLQTTQQLLKTQLLVLTNQKIEAEKLIAQFRIRYYQELGFIISDILKERLKLYEKIRDKNPDEQYEYEKTKEQYHKFFQQWEQVPKEQVSNVSEELRHKLISLYRKASKLCHPDIVDESKKEEASKIFVKINKAYIENDIETIEQIIEQLEKGLLIPDKETRNSAKILQAKILQLNEEIRSLKKEIEDLRNSSAYLFIVKLENWDKYFSETKDKLLKELEELKLYAKSYST